MKNKNHKCSMFHVLCSKNRGFSLIEILVAIGIMSVGIIAIVSLFSANLKDEIRDKNKLTAIYLAQEAVEVVRWQRDSNWKAIPPPPVSWDDKLDKLLPDHEGIIGLSNVGDITLGWEISKLTGVPDQEKKKVYKNITGNYYAQSDDIDLSALPASWENTGFERWITIINNVDCPASDCLEVTAFVSHPSFSPDIQVSTRIYDWKKP